MDLACLQTANTNCDPAMYLGVMCRTHQEIIELEINRTIIATRQQCAADPQSSTVPADPLSSIVTETSGTSAVEGQNNCNTTQIDLLQSQARASCDNTFTPALGGVVGFLLTLLVVLVIGWSLSCVALVKQTRKQTTW